MAKQKSDVTKEDFISHIMKMTKEEMYEYIKSNGKRKLIRPYSRIPKDNK